MKIEVLAGQADKVQGHKAILLQEFKWTKYSAVADRPSSTVTR